MRIRSIKPEFWRSDDIDALSIEDRFLFIGLWSYVDDNGVGRDKLSEVAADLFAGDLERDPSETFARVSRGLQNLFEAGRITRYTVDGKPYLHITNWEKHQRIDKPNKPRYPHPTCGNAVSRESVASMSRDPREIPAPGTGEQGNRGTGEVGSELANASSGGKPPRADIALIDNPTAQTLVAEWIDHCHERPPQRVIGQLSRELKQLLGEGIDPHRVRVALAEWNRKGLHPSALASVVHEITNRRPTQRGQQATDDMFDRAMQRAMERDAS